MRIEYSNEAFAGLLFATSCPTSEQLAVANAIAGLLETNPEFQDRIAGACLFSSNFTDRFSRVLEDYGVFNMVENLGMYFPIILDEEAIA